MSTICKKMSCRVYTENASIDSIYFCNRFDMLVWSFMYRSDSILCIQDIWLNLLIGWIFSSYFVNASIVLNMHTCWCIYYTKYIIFVYLNNFDVVIRKTIKSFGNLWILQFIQIDFPCLNWSSHVSNSRI